MKRKKFAAIISCSILVASQLASGDIVRAQESFRVKRTSKHQTIQLVLPPTVRLRRRINPAIIGANKYPKVLPAGSLRRFGTENSIASYSHNGSGKSVDTQFSKRSLSVGIAKQPEYARANRHHRQCASRPKIALGRRLLSYGFGGRLRPPIHTFPWRLFSGSRRLGEPLINVDAGHCPAMVDPAFQIPVRWWDDLSREQSDPVLGPQWKLWLDAVKEVFQAHASELKHTPGVASLHVIINPNGSIFNMSPYTGNERAHQELPISEPTLMNLRDIVGRVGMFPPFPGGTKVRCYHLIFDGSAGGVF